MNATFLSLGIKKGLKMHFVFFTCTRDSGKLILSATSSLIKISGYLVLVNKFSRMSSWALVKVVRSRRCFRVGIPERQKTLIKLTREPICPKSGWPFSKWSRSEGDCRTEKKLRRKFLSFCFLTFLTHIHFRYMNQRSANKARAGEKESGAKGI